MAMATRLELESHKFQTKRNSNMKRRRYFVFLTTQDSTASNNYYHCANRLCVAQSASVLIFNKRLSDKMPRSARKKDAGVVEMRKKDARKKDTGVVEMKKKDARKKDTGMVEMRKKDAGVVEMLRADVSRLMRFRSPRILRVLHPVEECR